MRHLSICITILLISAISFSQVPFRKYKTGEVYRYRLTTESSRNGGPAAVAVAISEHRVVQANGIPSEEIRWISKQALSGKDSISLDSIARTVAPYIVSLSPSGTVPLPALKEPEMVGEITDLNTFLVAVAPALNIQKLTKENPVYKNSEPRKGDFGDGIRILRGNDCVVITLTLLNSSATHSVVRIDFDPPPTFCLEPYTDTIAVSSSVPNNFQMVQKGNNGKVNFFWGIETFSITVTIDNADGRVTAATMTNDLKLTMRYNATEDLAKYDAQLPVTINRKLKLELLPPLVN